MAPPSKLVMGVKGPTSLSSLVPDFITRTAIHKMHCIDNGVIKKLLKLLFNPMYSSFPFSLNKVKSVVNSKLCGIKPPKFIHHMPRSVDELVH